MGIVVRWFPTGYAIERHQSRLALLHRLMLNTNALVRQQGDVCPAADRHRRVDTLFLTPESQFDDAGRRAQPFTSHYCADRYYLERDKNYPAGFRFCGVVAAGYRLA